LFGSYGTDGAEECVIAKDVKERFRKKEKDRRWKRKFPTGASSDSVHLKGKKGNKKRKICFQEKTKAIYCY
jgi:hypothetical protein